MGELLGAGDGHPWRMRRVWANADATGDFQIAAPAAQVTITGGCGRFSGVLRQPRRGPLAQVTVTRGG